MERLFGFGIGLDEALDPYRIEVLKEQAELIVARRDFDPNQYHLYFHQLTITLKARHFAAALNIRDRLEELRLTFGRNPKQNRNREIRFFNHLLDPSLVREVPSSPTESSVTYYLSGEYLANRLQFRNELITFISKDLRKDHRKIKISVEAFPTGSFQQRLRKRRKTYVTKLDLRYERYTPVSIGEPTSCKIGSEVFQYDDREYLIISLARLAAATADPVGYFRDLVDSLDIPNDWKLRMAGRWSGDALSDARHLINWAESKNGLPQTDRKPPFSVLGRIAERLFDDAGDARIKKILARL
jgi:hypothetical protein